MSHKSLETKLIISKIKDKNNNTHNIELKFDNLLIKRFYNTNSI